MSSSSIDDKDFPTVDQKAVVPDQLVITSKDADATLHFQEQYESSVPESTPQQEAKLSRKLQWIIIGMTALVDLVLYADKATASYASIFELWKDIGLDQNKYNNSNTLFYVGFFIGQANLYFVQRFPISKVLTVLCGLWTAVILLHCACTNYRGFYALRFFLGFIESIAIPILNTTIAQFLTAEEKAASAPIFYCSCLGVGIPVGFIAYGILHSPSTILPIWKQFMLIIGGCTFLLTILVYFCYPSNPTDAKFLSTEEKIWTIRRVQRSTGAGIEQKVFKKYQMVEALKDPISWLFGAFFLLQQLANNLSYQQNLLFEGIGRITNLDSTLVSVAGSAFAVACALLATLALKYRSNLTAFSVVFWTLPSLAGSIAVCALPWEKKIALLAMICMASNAFGVPWILMFSWNVTTASGYTKKLTRNAIVMCAYSVANIISPQIWQQQYAPRYYPAWIVQIVLSFFVAPLIALVIRYLLAKRNAERLADSTDKVAYVQESDGERVEVNIAVLDLTDLENKKFIYPL